MSSELALLRSTLQGLQSYELPPTYRIDQDNDRNNNANNDNNDYGSETKNDNGDDDDDATTAPFLFHNSQLLQRYKSARDSYIQQRTFEMFLTCLQNYDPVTNTIPLPNDDDHDEADGEEKLRKRQTEVMDSINGTMQKMTGDMDAVRSKWEQFCEKREELVQIVEGMERGERQLRLEGCRSSSSDSTKLTNAKINNEENVENNDGNGCSNLDDDDDDNGEEITDEDVTLQEEKLDELRQRKLALEERLRSVRAEILDVEDDCHVTKRAVNEVRVRGGRKPLDWRGMAGSKNGNAAATANSGSSSDEGGVSNAGNDEGRRDKEGDENVEYIPVVARGVDAEIAEMEEKAAELKASFDMYDGYRELMEELGGVKILSSRSIPASSATDGESPEKRQKLDKEAGEGFVITLMLLEKHILEITLFKTPNEKDGGLRVSDAKLTTPTTIPMPEPSTDGKASNDENSNNEMTTSLMETMHSVSLSNLSISKIMSQKPSVEVTIPPLDDLVSWSHSLESLSSSSSSSSSTSPHGIRFVIAETMARLRTSRARVAELATLRDRYAAQVYDVDSAIAEQEVVCAINEGITVALRLGADCPLAPGSVYVSEMFGVGGWEDRQLEELKNAVKCKRCRGPVEVMECLVDEIRRRGEKGEEGWVVPTTPTLPRRGIE